MRCDWVYREWELYYDEDFNRIRKICNNHDEIIKEVWFLFNEEQEYKLLDDKNYLKDYYSLLWFEFNLSAKDRIISNDYEYFLTNTLLYLKESFVSEDIIKSIAKDFINKPLETYEFFIPFFGGFNMVGVIIEWKLFSFNFDEYIYNFINHGFGGAVYTFSFHHFNIQNRDTKHRLELICKQYFDAEYKAIKIVKDKKYWVKLESELEYLWDDIKFVELKNKFPHSKIEADNYKWRINKYRLTEKKILGIFKK